MVQPPPSAFEPGPAVRDAACRTGAPCRRLLLAPGIELLASLPQKLAPVSCPGTPRPLAELSSAPVGPRPWVEARGPLGEPDVLAAAPLRSSGGASFAECLCLRLTPASAPESCGCSGLAEPLHAACLGHPETLLLHSCRLPGSCTRPSEVTGPRYSWKSCLELDP
ncbi:unnamed protein product [Rangifer tarandus platyrhynchus]|uniref:Uncharacterized protein n=1 Tax=Rangifer tarandus platyrhynchus TaxID=3082113 RepID=A0AC59Y2L8_RANTA